MKFKFYKIFNYLFFIWSVGLEQFFFTPYFAYVTYLKNNKIRFVIPTFFISVILILMIINLVNIKEPIKLFQLLRNIYTMIGALFIFHYFSSYGKSFNNKNNFINTIAISSFVIVFCGFVPLIGINFEYKSIMYYLFSTIDIPLLNQYFTKTFADEGAGGFFESYITDFVRPRGLMSFPNQLAQICLLTFGSCIYLFFNEKQNSFNSRNIFFVIGIILSIIVLLSTLSRGSWIALSISTIFIIFLDIVFRRKISILNMIFILFLLIILLAFNAFELVLSRFDNAHSDEGRMLNYITSIKMSLSSFYSFFIGHGTQITISFGTDNVHLGSHSAYVGIFFKYGIFALLAYISFQVYIFYKNFQAFLSKKIDHKLFYYFTYLLIVFAITPIFYEIDVDMINILYSFTLYGLIYDYSK